MRAELGVDSNGQEDKSVWNQWCLENSNLEDDDADA